MSRGLDTSLIWKWHNFVEGLAVSTQPPPARLAAEYAVQILPVFEATIAALSAVDPGGQLYDDLTAIHAKLRAVDDASRGAIAASAAELGEVELNQSIGKLVHIAFELWRLSDGHPPPET